jgi:hypothetical protein
MTFEEALKAMREGKKVRLPDWTHPIIMTKQPVIHFEDDVENTPYLGANSILKNDWEIVE